MQEIGLNEPIDGEYLIYRGTKTPNQGFDSSIGHIIQKRTPRYDLRSTQDFSPANRLRIAKNSLLIFVSTER
jgi:hypothetical protein